MEENLSLCTSLEVRLAFSVLIFEVLRPKITKPLHLEARLFIFALPASLLAVKFPLITASLLLCFSTAPFLMRFTQESISMALSRAMASGVWLTALLFFHQKGFPLVLIPLSSYRIYWVFHFTLWIYFLISRRPSFLIFRTWAWLRWIEELVRFFRECIGTSFIELSNRWILFYTRAILKNSAKCVGCFINYLVYYAILRGICSLT